MAIITKDWTGTEYFELTDVDHLEFYVGNARQAVHFYRSAFGFEPLAYAGPETGRKTAASYVLRQNQIHLVLTTPLHPDHEGSEWLKKHGDGVRDIAFRCVDAKQAYESAMSRGALSAYEPTESKDPQGTFQRSGIKAYGETIHSFINRKAYSGLWEPGFAPLELPPITHQNPRLLTIDHVVANVEEAKMDVWKDYYERIFGFTNFVVFDETDITTQYSSLKSRVMRSKNWKIKLPINEPAKGLKKSQIQEYLDFNVGPGVQHIALLSGNIIETIQALRANGVNFLHVPDTYYDSIQSRVGAISEDMKTLKGLKILIDRDEDGYLLQLFTKPVEDRPTLFFEIIQRHGSQSFGQGNFQALFEAIEREQALRGNL